MRIQARMNSRASLHLLVQPTVFPSVIGHYPDKVFDPCGSLAAHHMVLFNMNGGGKEYKKVCLFREVTSFMTLTYRCRLEYSLNVYYIEMSLSNTRSSNNVKFISIYHQKS